MGLVKRKATKAARKMRPDFADIKLTFLQRVAEIVHESKVPPELVINWDQTGAKFVHGRLLNRVWSKLMLLV